MVIATALEAGLRLPAWSVALTVYVYVTPLATLMSVYVRVDPAVEPIWLPSR
jgi:hypothetical protein